MVVLRVHATTIAAGFAVATDIIGRIVVVHRTRKQRRKWIPIAMAAKDERGPGREFEFDFLQSPCRHP